MAMFANNRAGQQSSGFLVEFKAGRSAIESGSTTEKRRIVTEKTKGMIYIRQTPDQLMHFCWKNRESGSVDDDLIIFPGDTKFMPVKECVDGRVFVLKFLNSENRRFFWMQEPSAEKDEELCRKVNDVLNNPPSARSMGRGNSGRAAALGSDGQDLGGLGNLDQGQIMQLLSLMQNQGGGSGGLSFDSTSTSAVLPQLGIRPGSQTTPEQSPAVNPNVSTPLSSTADADADRQPNTTEAPIRLSELQNIISSISVPTTQMTTRPAIELESLLSSENLRETISNEDNEARLLPHLPTEEPIEPNRQELRETITTPQFRQATEIFGHALQTGELGSVLQQFGVPSDVVDAANTGDIEKFAQRLTAVEQGKKADEKSESSAESEKQRTQSPKNEDNMELD